MCNANSITSLVNRVYKGERADIHVSPYHAGQNGLDPEGCSMQELAERGR